MTKKTNLKNFDSLKAVAKELKDERLKNKIAVLLYAYNGTGKTRLSTEFKNLGKNGESRDTLYFNAFTEDLFSWDNDLDGDEVRELRLNTKSRFFKNIFEFTIDISNRIGPFLSRYADFGFDILEKEVELDESNQKRKENITYVSFSRDVVENGVSQKKENIKISRGEENTFIWCFFLAVAQLAIDRDESYKWVKYIYIDDPISSLDDNNSILIACDLVALIKDQIKDKTKDEINLDEKVRVVISTHHSLFFNVICNEFTRSIPRFLLHKERGSNEYILLQDDTETPISYHVACLSELKRANEAGLIEIHHFGMLRAVMEKTSVFLGYENFSDCLDNEDEKNVYARALNLFSHGKGSIFEFREPNQTHKELFGQVLTSFLNKQKFNLPSLSDQAEGVTT
ncbi:MAG: AAA family ATPase [Methylotenera sp.]|nr:AAA family ATPase [Methylotenera sp.]